MTTYFAVGGLALVILLGIAIVAIVRPRTGQIDAGPSSAFAAAMYGLLLGLLLFAGQGHFDAARSAANDEATKNLALYSAATGLPTADQNRIQHDVVCVMRATIDSEWPAMATGDTDGAVETQQAVSRLYDDITSLEHGNPVIDAQFGSIFGLLLDRGQLRNQRLFEANRQVSPALWLVAFIGAMVIVVITGLEVAEPNRRRWLVAMVPIFLLLGVVFYVLAAIDQPFQGATFAIDAGSLRHALDVIVAGRPDPGVLGPCAA
ncbi:MAG: hypothetical protein ACR2J9_02950 [Gaiellales bacterium]